jgi:hypothetical protein
MADSHAILHRRLFIIFVKLWNLSDQEELSAASNSRVIISWNDRRARRRKLAGQRTKVRGLMS